MARGRVDLELVCGSPQVGSGSVSKLRASPYRSLHRVGGGPDLTMAGASPAGEAALRAWGRDPDP